MQKHSKRITPTQYLVMLVILALAVILRFQGFGNEQPATEDPTTTIGFSQTPHEPPLTETGSPQPPGRTPRPTVAQPSTPTSSEGIIPEHLSDFDYFVLALSWSPDYCATSGDNDPQQCSLGKKLGFVLHGLWPQYEKGYPSNCSTEKMPSNVKAQFPGLYPNDKLFDHEWEKHGTCTGLSPVEYLQVSQAFKTAVVIPGEFRLPEKPFRASPDQLKELFVRANPGFEAADFEVSCSGSGRYLKEIFVCFSREGTATNCSAEMHKTALKSCQAKDFLVRNTR